MTPDPEDRVGQAVKLIDPPEERLAECEKKVRNTLSFVEEVPRAVGLYENSKRAKLQAGRLSKVIRRLIVARGHRDLPIHLRSFFPGTDERGIFNKDFARALGRQSRFGALRPRETKRWLEEWLKRAEAAQTKKGKPIQREATKKKMAIHSAINLLLRYKKEVSAAKDSKLCQLAAHLYGQPKANLRRQCAALLRTEYGHLLRPKWGSK